MTSQNNNDVKMQTLRRRQKKRIQWRLRTETRGRPREYGVKEASFKKKGGNQVLHR